MKLGNDEALREALDERKSTIERIREMKYELARIEYVVAKMLVDSGKIEYLKVDWTKLNQDA